MLAAFARLAFDSSSGLPSARVNWSYWSISGGGGYFLPLLSKHAKLMLRLHTCSTPNLPVCLTRNDLAVKHLLEPPNVSPSTVHVRHQAVVDTETPMVQSG